MNLNSPSTTTIAVAADYADAMMTARKAKNVLFLLLLLVLLIQLAMFFLLKFNVIHLGDEVAVEATSSTASAPATAPSTQAADAATQPVESPSATAVPEARRSGRVQDILRYVIPVTDFAGITLGVVMAVVLLLIVTIMLVGRLIGVSHVTSAFIWCVILTVLLFPWQAFLIGGPWNHPASGGKELGYDIRHFADYDTMRGALKWVRYAGFPIVALLLLLSVQAKSSRGLKFALGESEVQVEVSSPQV
jgi:hypothetical protein